MDLNGLNKEQKEAVTHVNGPMLVLAGAGSGKTRVLTNRIAYLIENEINAENILAITFTNKAAKEMKERVFKLIGSQANSIQISTFHSLGLRLLKENYSRGICLWEQKESQLIQESLMRLRSFFQKKVLLP